MFGELEGGRAARGGAGEETAPDRADLSPPWDAFDSILNTHSSASVDFKQKE